MTPKEAIETIKTAIAEVEWEYPMDYAAAFDVAIKALEVQNAVMHIDLPEISEDDIVKMTKIANHQSLNVPSKDTIYRQDAIDEIDKMFEHEVNSEIDAVWNQAVEMASNKIKYDLPPAQPEVLAHGEGELSAQPDWGKPVGDGRPLADSEVIPRLQDIKRQIGGSYAIDRAVEVLEELQEAQPEQQHVRTFQEIVVEYPSISAYPEYEGRPYFSIKYTEDGKGFIGYGTYKPGALSEYLKEYFIPSVQPEPKTGHWIYVGDGYADYCKCSECGNLSDYEENFCCECGADMRTAKHGTKIDLCIMDEVEGRT